MAKDLPYFKRYSQEIDQCLGGANCQGITQMMQQTPGRYIDFRMFLKNDLLRKC